MCIYLKSHQITSSGLVFGLKHNAFKLMVKEFNLEKEIYLDTIRSKNKNVLKSIETTYGNNQQETNGILDIALKLKFIDTKKDFSIKLTNSSKI